MENRHRFRVIDWLIDNKEPTIGIQQNIIYHMIPCLEFPSDVEEQLIAVLLGEPKIHLCFYDVDRETRDEYQYR